MKLLKMLQTIYWRNSKHFRLRWNNYKSTDRKFQRGERCQQKHLFRNFYSEGHDAFVKDVSITLIDQTDASDPKKRESG